MKKQIICIGGGGFGRNPKQRLIEEYILDQSNVDTPNILFIPTASAEDKSYIVNFYSWLFNTHSFDLYFSKKFTISPKNK